MAVTGVVTYGAGTSYETQVEITAEQKGTGVSFVAKVASDAIADLRGVFFDVGGEFIPSDSKQIGKKTVSIPFVDPEPDFAWARGPVDGDFVTSTS